MTDEEKEKAVAEGRRAVELFRDGTIMFLGYNWHMRLILRAQEAGASLRDLGVTAVELGKGHGSFYQEVLIRQAKHSVRLLREESIGLGGYERHIEYLRTALCTGVGREELENVTDIELGDEEGSFFKKAERVQARVANSA